MKVVILFILLIFSAIPSFMAQELVFDGRLTDVDSKKRIGDVTVTVFEGGKQIFQTTSASNGKYLVNIPLNKTLKVQFTKSGYVTKTMSINSGGINEEDIPIGGQLFPPIDIDLFTNRPNVDFGFLNSEPVVEWSYDPSKFGMWYNEGKMMAMKSKIEGILEKAENEGKENEAKYNQLIADADKLFMAEDYENALTNYSDALSVPGKSTEVHPNNRIVEIDNILKKKAKEEMLNQQANQAYQNVIDAGDSFFASKDYDKAAKKYHEAQSMRPAEQYPKDRLAEIETIKKAAASKAEYDELIKSADMFLKQNSLKLAEDKYIKASKLDPSQEYPKLQLEKITTKLKEQEDILEKKKKYDEAILAADALYKSKKYREAKAKYEEAITIESTATYPVERVKMCQEKIKEQEEASAKAEEYAALVKAGDDAMKASNYESAIESYTAALDIKKDVYPEGQLNLAREKLAELADSASKKAKIEELFSQAEEKIGSENFAGAIEDYKAILALEASNNVAFTEKGKAESALKAQQEKAAAMAEFNKLKMEGDTYFAQKKWVEAKEKYTAANAIQTDEKVDGNLIIIEQELSKLASAKENEAMFKSLVEKAKSAEKDKELQKSLDFYTEALNYNEGDAATINKIKALRNQLLELEKSAEKEKLYAEAMDRGKKALDAKDYANAVNSFDDAMLYKPMAPEAIKLKAAANKALSELSKNEEVFQKLLSQGLKLKNAGDLYAAKNVYEQAQQMRPSDPVPQNAIIEINDLLRKKLEEENQYKSAIRKADLAYDEKRYEESIDLYNKALSIQEEQYAKDQIIKAQLALKNQEAEALNREYQAIIKKANDYFSTERYESAIEEYKRALTVLPSDKYAQDRRDETQQILDNRAERSKEESAKKAAFDKLVAEADMIFESKEYINAKIKYEDALRLYPSDPYLLKRVEESIRLSKKEGEGLEEAAYRKVVDKADEYFAAANYEKAKKLYERALTLRSYDTYPKDQLDEIRLILNGPVKEEVNLEYLGEQVDLSIIDGAALFEKSAKQQEQDKKQRILKRIFANEKNFGEKTTADWSERNEYQNEIIYLKDRRALLNVENNQNQHELAIDLDNEEFSIKKKAIQENKFERSSLLRQNEELIFIMDDFNTIHNENSEEHLANADKLDLIVLEKAELDRSMEVEEEVIRRRVNKDLVEISDDLTADYQRAIEFKEINDDVVRNLDIKMDSKSEREIAENYQKLQGLKSDATIAEIQRYKTSAQKAIIQLQLEDDIALLVGLQSEKNYFEVKEVQNEALEMDALLLAANNTYKESYANNDNARRETVEDIKVIQAGDAERTIEANNKKYSEIQNNTQEVITIKDMNDAKVIAMDEGLLAIREEIVAQEKMIVRTYDAKDVLENASRESNVDAIDNTKMSVNKVHAEQAKKPGENSEVVKDIENSLNLGEQARKEDFNERKYETKKLLDDMASNKIQFNEIIANTLGDEFPEGVTQQTYLAKDKDGYPQKITTRRIVVLEGRGEVYLRIQTRNAVTYSKNGQPITEASWIKGTEDANLVRHF